MAAKKTTDVFQKYVDVLQKYVLTLAPIITALIAILMFIFEYPVTAGILLIASALLLGTLLALHERIPRWGRLPLVALLFLLFAVGVCSIAGVMPPKRQGENDSLQPRDTIRPDQPVEPVDARKEWDFEDGTTQGWGEHPEGEVHVSGKGVEVYRDNLSPISKTGNSSLKFIPTKMVKNNAYVTVLENAQGSAIKAHIFVPSGVDISTAQNNSTARIIVWDKSWTAHESGFIELDSGVWQPISWNLHEQEWPGPWREFGIHFYFVTDYKGPIYIDTVTLE